MRENERGGKNDDVFLDHWYVPVFRLFILVNLFIWIVCWVCFSDFVLFDCWENGGKRKQNKVLDNLSERQQPMMC